MPRPETADKAAIELPPISRPDTPPPTVEDIFEAAYRRSNMGGLPLTYTPRELGRLEYYLIYGEGQSRFRAYVALAISGHSFRNR